MTEANVEVGSPETGQPAHDLRAFRRALSNFATGVTIVTSSHESQLVGVTANSFSSVSLDPPLVLWSIDRKSTSIDTFLSATHFAINILSDSQIDLSNKFARTSDEKFSGVDWTAGAGGAPLIEGAVAHLECSREVEYDGGDHVIMVGRVEKYTRYDSDPLVFARGRYVSAVDIPVPEKAVESRSADFEPVGTPPMLRSLLQAHEGISERFAAYRQAERLSYNHSRTLTLLRVGPAESISDLARRALISQSAAEDALAVLLGRGLAESTETGGYRITPAGVLLANRLIDGMRQVELEVASHAPELDIDTAREWLASLARAALTPRS